MNYEAPMLRALVPVALLALGSVALGDEAAQLVALDAQAHAMNKGAVRIGEPVHGFAPKMDWAASLTPGACYVVAGRVGAGARTVAVTLFSPDGKRVASSKPGSTTSVRYCATWLGSYHVQARTDGAGTYLVGTYMVSSRSGMPAGGEIAPPPPLIAGPVAPPPPTVVYQPVYQPVYVPVPVAQPQPTTTIVYGGTPSYGGPYNNAAPVYAGSSGSDAQHHGNLIVTPVVGTKGGDCKSSLDCGPGEFCKEDSYGYKACMGDGHRGMPCSSSIDCGSGMFCKEIDGDASYKVCR
jgi:hypothetical protein